MDSVGKTNPNNPIVFFDISVGSKVNISYECESV